MKNFQIPLVAFALLLGACSSMQNTSRINSNDDLYFSLADAKKFHVNAIVAQLNTIYKELLTTD